jgi:hypothetical protein
MYNTPQYAQMPKYFWVFTSCDPKAQMYNTTPKVMYSLRLDLGVGGGLVHLQFSENPLVRLKCYQLVENSKSEVSSSPSSRLYAIDKGEERGRPGPLCRPSSSSSSVPSIPSAPSAPSVSLFQDVLDLGLHGGNITGVGWRRQA